MDLVDIRAGDLFAQGFPALAHGVTCVGVMDHGFRVRWPAMYDRYRARCRAGMLRLGGLMSWKAPDGLIVYNLVVAQRAGTPPDLTALRSALAAALDDAERREIRSIGLPQFGDWDVVGPVVREVAAGSSVRIVVMRS
ncbi:macro domain-containing protein [Actinoplanes missouriensis]|uniref:Appr-1-p processing protein n=1 Tax=Actinoplanes missouriensis TaxID=1866 RepID=UPI00030E0EFB|nr:Appr-1-p processing protein [Actinoplanes missouriensis]